MLRKDSSGAMNLYLKFVKLIPLDDGNGEIRPNLLILLEIAIFITFFSSKGKWRNKEDMKISKKENFKTN